MKAIWLEEGRVTLRDDAPEPDAPGEAIVRVTRAGVCATDLELIKGYYPFTGVLGHEFVGVVERGPDDLQGRRVVGEINAVCRECSACRAGRSTHCERRTVLGIVGRHGAFATHLALPPENLHVLPDELEDDAAVFAEPLAAALAIPDQVEIRPSDRVLVVGDGRLGQLVARVLARTGADVRAVGGRHERKHRLLEEAGVSVTETVRPGSFDTAVECTGNADGFRIAREALRPRGTLVLKSTYAGQLTFDASAVVVDEIRLVGSRCGPFAPAVRLLARGEVDPRPLIDERFPLHQAEEALEHAARPGVLKVLLDV